MIQRGFFFIKEKSLKQVSHTTILIANVAGTVFAVFNQWVQRYQVMILRSIFRNEWAARTSIFAVNWNMADVAS